MNSLLVAGPTRLDADGLIVGSGALAAMAAAPSCHCQLWSHGGSAFDQRMSSYLENRRIDLAGFSTEGQTIEQVDDGLDEHLALPDLRPAAADDFFGSLLIDLRPEEFRQALSDLQAMTTRRIQRFLVAPPLDIQAQFDQLSDYISAS